MLRVYTFSIMFVGFVWLGACRTRLQHNGPDFEILTSTKIQFQPWLTQFDAQSNTMAGTIVAESG